jgi:hypothetical protein
MGELKKLVDSVIVFYKDGKEALADKKIQGGEIIKLVMDGVSAAQTDWSKIPDEFKSATIEDKTAIMSSAAAALGDDSNKDKVVSILGMILFSGGLF